MYIIVCLIVGSFYHPSEHGHPKIGNSVLFQTSCLTKKTRCFPVLGRFPAVNLPWFWVFLVALGPAGLLKHSETRPCPLIRLRPVLQRSCAAKGRATQRTPWRPLHLAALPGVDPLVTVWKLWMHPNCSCWLIMRIWHWIEEHVRGTSVAVSACQSSHDTGIVVTTVTIYSYFIPH